DKLGGPSSTIGLDRAVCDLASDLTRDRIRDLVRVGRRELHVSTGTVPVEAVPYVEVLFEVVVQREVEERAARGRQLHGRGQAALDDGQVTYRQVPVQTIDVAVNLEAVAARQ